MSKRHDAIFDDVLKGLDGEDAGADRAGARFLRRTNALAETANREEKTLHWVDPEDCVMWEGHNRAYGLLTEENCRDLIDSMRAQGRQEFPAIVRRRAGDGPPYEVICGARRHFAVSWLRANTYPQFRYLVEVRDLTDEEAFRLADLENRDRADLSDLERARDYARALKLYYGGKQKAMASRLEVSEAWLSRYLALAKLPEAIVEAFPHPADLRELHARRLRPALADPAARARLLAEAEAIAAERRAGRGVGAAAVVARLNAAAAGPRPPAPDRTVLRRSPHESGVEVRIRGRRTVLEFDTDLSDAALRAAFDAYLAHRRDGD
ncbi:MAG: ParB/RepB/Spo0J family partition protein [Alkalilacustris sp.]